MLLRKVIYVRKLLRNTRVPSVDTKVKHRKVGNYCCYYFDKYSYFFKSKVVVRSVLRSTFKDTIPLPFVLATTTLQSYQ